MLPKSRPEARISSRPRAVTSPVTRPLKTSLPVTRLPGPRNASGPACAAADVSGRGAPNSPRPPSGVTTSSPPLRARSLRSASFPKSAMTSSAGAASIAGRGNGRAGPRRRPGGSTTGRHVLSTQQDEAFAPARRPRSVDLVERAVGGQQEDDVGFLPGLPAAEAGRRAGLAVRAVGGAQHGRGPPVGADQQVDLDATVAVCAVERD